MEENLKKIDVATIDIYSLAKNYNKRLLHFALRRGASNQEDAEDIVQSAYIEAIRCADQFLGNSLPETWLMGIVLNLTRNKLAKAYRKYEFSSSTNGTDEEDSWLDNIYITNENPQSASETREALEQVMNTFSDMSEEMRDTASLVLIEELSYEDTAKEMNIPVGTVRSRVARARKILKVLQEQIA